MSLRAAISRRVTINIEVCRTLDELAAVRWANGTAPHTLADWLELIWARAFDLDPSERRADEALVDELIGLAADVHGLLELLAADDTEGAV